MEYSTFTSGGDGNVRVSLLFCLAWHRGDVALPGKIIHRNIAFLPLEKRMRTEKLTEATWRSWQNEMWHLEAAWLHEAETHDLLTIFMKVTLSLSPLGRWLAEYYKLKFHEKDGFNKFKVYSFLQQSILSVCLPGSHRSRVKRARPRAWVRLPVAVSLTGVRAQ